MFVSLLAKKTFIKHNLTKGSDALRGEAGPLKRATITQKKPKKGNKKEANHHKQPI